MLLESKERGEFREEVRAWAAEHVAPSAGERDESERFDRGILEEAGRFGLCGLPYPAEYGGGGGDFVDFVIACEEMARACAATVLAFASSAALAAGAIHRAGSEEQKRRYLTPLAKGEKLGCFSLTEPQAGSDIASLRTRATREGDGYLLNGKKSFATNSGEADIYVLFASTDPSAGGKGISAFILERETPGISFGPPLRKLGMRATVQREVLLGECRVPATNLLGREGEGMKLALGTLDLGRVGIAAQALGLAEAAYSEALGYAKSRTAFGKPLAAQQSVAFKLADVATEIRAARHLVYEAAHLALDPGRRISKEAAMAKMYASDVAMRAALEAVQILGGLSCTKASPVERYFRDAKVIQVYDGTNEIMKLIISAAILAQG